MAARPTGRQAVRGKPVTIPQGAGSNPAALTIFTKGQEDMFTIRPGKLVIPAPKEGACRLCGEIHGAGEPHNLGSLLYQHRFRAEYGRYPTWEDAMSHCSETVKKRFRERLEKHGIPTGDDGAKT